MKIALDARLVYYRRYSGIGQYIVQLAERLPRLDRDNTYTIIHSRKDRTAPHDPLAHRAAAWTPSHHRLEQAAFPLELLRLKIDLLHSPDFIPPFRGSFKRVITVHDLNFLYYPQFLTPESRRYYNDQIARAVQAADHILADSHATRLDLIKLLNVPIKGTLAGNSGGALTGFHDAFEGLLLLRRVRVAGTEFCGVDDRGQYIVELVGDARSQFTNTTEPLRLKKLLSKCFGFAYRC
jgi:hypothetical protein